MAIDRQLQRIRLSRRAALKTGVGLALLPFTLQARTPARGPLLASGYYARGPGALAAGVRWQALGSNVGDAIRLDFRVHGIAVDPARRGRFIAFARRPGVWMVDVDTRSASVTQLVRTAADRHLYGHGVFSPDGRRLYTTENDFENGAGRIAIRDSTTLDALGEIHSGGVGPHMLAFLSDGRTMVVANGGIRTHPARPREKLNITAMRPSLDYIDSVSGALIEHHVLPDSNTSIRHLDVLGDRVVLVQQQEGGNGEDAALVVSHRRGQRPRVLDVPPYEHRRMNGYTASVAISADGSTALVTCPRGNVVTIWDLHESRLIRSLDMRKPYGVVRAVDGSGFIVSTARGVLYGVSAEGDQVKAMTGESDDAWDNHLSLMDGGS